MHFSFSFLLLQLDMIIRTVVTVTTQITRANTLEQQQQWEELQLVIVIKCTTIITTTTDCDLYTS